MSRRIERETGPADHRAGPPTAARQRARSECMHEARTQQGGLSAPRGSDEREEPPLGEMTNGLGDHLLPTEEELRIDRLEPCEPFVRTHVGWTYGLRSHRLAAFQ